MVLLKNVSFYSHFGPESCHLHGSSTTRRHSCLHHFSLSLTCRPLSLHKCDFYRLASHQQTDENSLVSLALWVFFSIWDRMTICLASMMIPFSPLSINNRLLCRLPAALCLNFLTLMHLDSRIVRNNHGQETACSSIMGHMDVIKFIAGGFNVYHPICMCIFCLATFLEIDSLFLSLHFIRMKQFLFKDWLRISSERALVSWKEEEKEKEKNLLMDRRLVSTAIASTQLNVAQSSLRLERYNFDFFFSLVQGQLQ